MKFFIVEKAYQHETYETIIKLVKNCFKKIISKWKITKITNKYDEHGGVNNNWDGGKRTISILKHISVKNQKDRVKFVEDILKETPNFFAKILFSDECDIFSKQLWQNYIGEDLELEHGPTSNRDSITVKVWGIISANTVRTLII